MTSKDSSKAVMEWLSSIKNKSSRAQYSSRWQHWVKYCKINGLPDNGDAQLEDMKQRCLLNDNSEKYFYDNLLSKFFVWLTTEYSGSKNNEPLSENGATGVTTAVRSFFAYHRYKLERMKGVIPSVDKIGPKYKDNQFDIFQLRSMFAQGDLRARSLYDFIEFIANVYEDDTRNEAFEKTCNEILESEMSAYRFVGKQITKITSEKEIESIEEALATPLKPVNSHIENALKLMSDRQAPDYRNSIKESISAVEATCNLLVGKKVTLGQCLKEVKEKIGLHGALEKAFSSLYGLHKRGGRYQACSNGRIYKKAMIIVAVIAISLAITLVFTFAVPLISRYVFENYYLETMKNLNASTTKQTIRANIMYVYNFTELFTWEHLYIQWVPMGEKFDRTNDPIKILANGKGRCGEFSILYVSACLSLGYEARLLVSVKADGYSELHNWAEVRLNDLWVHVDPTDQI
jgi:hypothetical protein